MELKCHRPSKDWDIGSPNIGTSTPLSTPLDRRSEDIVKVTKVYEFHPLPIFLPLGTMAKEVYCSSKCSLVTSTITVTCLTSLLQFPQATPEGEGKIIAEGADANRGRRGWEDRETLGARSTFRFRTPTLNNQGWSTRRRSKRDSSLRSE